MLFPNHSRLRRKYVKNRPLNSPPPPPPPPLSRQQSLREQAHTSPSPTLRNTSNGVSLRSKQQQQQQQQFANTGFQSSSRDMGKKLKRFTLDTMDSRWHHQYQMVPNNSQNFDPNIYRSSMALVPSLNGTVYGAQVNSDLQIRPKVMNGSLQLLNYLRFCIQTRDLVRSRTIDCHAPTIPSVETTPILQRTPSRQTNAVA